MEWLPFQAPDLLERFPQVSREACEKAMHLVRDDGTVWVGGDAVPELLRIIGMTPVAAALALPGLHGLVNSAYNWVAGHRHQLGCDSHACTIGPPPEDS